jgi:hypothetical protein
LCLCLKPSLPTRGFMDGRRQFRKVGLLEGNVKCHDSSNEAKTENHFIKDYIWVWPNRVGCTLSSRSICNFYCCTSCYMILTLLFWLFLCVLTLRKRWCPFLCVFLMLCSSPGAPPPPPSAAPSASGVSDQSSRWSAEFMSWAAQLLKVEAGC